jgi:hypothetical protein
MVSVIGEPAHDLYQEARQMKTGRSRDYTGRIMFAVGLLALSACTSQTVQMIQPQTGATAECSGSSYGIGPLFSESFVDSCARLYENRGYVALQRLTPEQRASLEKRGLLPKD